MEPLREHAALYCARCGHIVQRVHARECETCPRLYCGMCDDRPCVQRGGRPMPGGVEVG